MPRLARTLPRSSLQAAGVTDTGRQRRHNEDALLLSPELGLFGVADGMGGHNAGRVASHLIVASMTNFFGAVTSDSRVPPGLLDEHAEDLSTPAQRLAAAVRKANFDVHEISATQRRHQGMGSTVVALHYDEARQVAHIAHVGDSRCYRLRAGSLEQLTRDHSLVNDALAAKPDLTPGEIARLPRNIITRALGMRATLDVDCRSEIVLHDDVFVLCSDGLSGMVTDSAILEALLLCPDEQEAAELLVEMANDAGGTDNVTVVIVRATGCDEPSSSRRHWPELTVRPAQQREREPLACKACGQAIYEGFPCCVECGAIVAAVG